MQRSLFVALLVLVTSVLCDSQSYIPIDCDDIYRHNNSISSGVYTIFPGGPTTPLHVYCDMDTDGGRWTVFQRRLDGSENFYRPWAHYKKGFGNVAGEYWLGLENIFLLTMRNTNELRVDMEDLDREKRHAMYSSFLIGSGNTGYQLHLGNYAGGSAGDSLSEHNNMKFTTFDKDQDQCDENCAQKNLGGFWYNNCVYTNPNGIYAADSPLPYNYVNIVWSSWKGFNYSLKNIAMKMRPVDTWLCES